MSSSPFFASVSEFVGHGGGNHAIEKILVANNGLGATKAIRSIRKWAFETFGDERKIKFVVMATPEDLRANAEFIRLADEVVDVPGGSNNNNYANINLICEIAVRNRVDAVMPMWGHASENPLLPTSLLSLPRRVTFIGPSAAPMQALGDKIGSTIIAQSAGVPVIAWNGDNLRVDYQSTGIPDEVYAQANVTSVDEAMVCVMRIGCPVMIKASEGGGGKGIRKVLNPADVPALFRQVQSEVPGSPIFVMKMASKARHLEVQLLADQHGQAIALSGRDCSVQRRHQKIIEEGPPTAAPNSVFREMERAAVALAKTVGYANAGTVEYLFMEEDHSFAFLELNPRLQVEHPVTENILGLNLPACQLQVAMGLPLHAIGDIRRLYGRHPRGRDTIDFEYSERQVAPRHCIAVRITAENPEAAFQPTSGQIEQLQFRSSVNVWGYFSVDNNSRVHEFADSQFGHIFAGGADREAARRAMVVALKEITIRGEIRTTVEYIIKLLQSDDFVANRIDTAWLDGRIERHKEISLIENAKFCPAPTLVALCGSALQGFRHFAQKGSEFIDMLKVGQVPSKDTLHHSVNIDLIFNNIKYRTNVIQSSVSSVLVECNGTRDNVDIRTLSDGGYLVNAGGSNHVVYLKSEVGGAIRAIIDGHTCMFTPEYDPTRLTSSVAGKFARQLVPEGTHLEAGDAYVEIEVMKMYMPLRAHEAGTVHFQLSEGATLNPGDIIAIMRLDRPDKVVKAERFNGSLSSSVVSGSELTSDAAVPPNLVMREAWNRLESVMEGFYATDNEINHAMDTFLDGFHNEAVPSLELDEAMAVLRGRIDGNLSVAINQLNDSYKTKLNAFQVAGGLTSPASSVTGAPDFPAVRILVALHEHAQSLTPADHRAAFVSQTSSVWSTVEKYLYPAEVRKVAALQQLIEKYLQVEKLFDNMSFTDVVSDLRKDASGDLRKVLNLCRSTVNITAKNALLLRVMDELKQMSISTAVARPIVPVGLPLRNEINTRNLKLRLKDVAKLRQQDYIHVSFSANLVLMSQNTMKIDARKQKFHDAITTALSTGESVGEGERTALLKKFVDSNVIIRDLLLDALRHDHEYQIAAMELYLLKIYQATHNLKGFSAGSSLTHDNSESSPWIKFSFNTKKVAVDASGGMSRELPRGSSELSELGGVDDGQKSSRRVSVSKFDISSPSRSSSAPSPAALSYPSAITTEDTAPVNALRHPLVQGNRQGILAAVDHSTDLTRLLPLMIGKISSAHVAKYGVVNAIHVLVARGDTPATLAGTGAYTDDDMAQYLSDVLKVQLEALRSKGVRRVSFFVGHPSDKRTSTASGSSSTSIFTYRYRSEFSEDKLFRQIEAPHAFHLDLPRLSNFSVALESNSSTTGNVFLYRATPKDGKGQHRFFVRLVSFSSDSHSSEAEALFVEAIDHLGLVVGRDESSQQASKKAVQNVSYAANHVFLNVVSPDSVVPLQLYVSELQRICSKYWFKMVRLGISSVEFKLGCKLNPDSEPIFVRLVASNPTGFVLKIDKYYESNDEITGKTVFKTVGSDSGDAIQPGPWQDLDTQTPYETSQPFERQRAEAMSTSDTLYVYDWPLLFASAVNSLWEANQAKAGTPFTPTSPKAAIRKVATTPNTGDAGISIVRAESRAGVPHHVGELFSCRELVLCDPETKQPLAKGWTAKQAESNSVLLPIDRNPGLNDVGMVAWLATLCTPECPEGRKLVITCNDITFQAGSFGTKEDIVFYKASQYAREHGYPRFFLAANSGARIGMAQSLKSKFKVAWSDENDPSRGFKYIYLTSDDYNSMLERAAQDIKQLPVICTPVDHFGETRYQITDIIGEEPDLGVENLMGSGLIAGETARAYNEVFTLTLVVARTVGIGAYLVRLGQRTIQKTRNCPIILTGYQALNKLMGREIYTTNDQLGGPMIMFPNGVTHMLAETHMQSVIQSLQWLSFVPTKRGASLPVLNISGYDSISRSIEFMPPKGLPYDPRFLLTGNTNLSDGDDYWESGFLDKDSFVEVLAGWAKTVVVGRGRLGGIPVGVIVTENRTAEATKPADPADITSQEKMVQQAGGVWFPDSAYKTAQALRDFNHEGLPCVVFANWRGFSGGQRDMFDEVLKFGSMIVDALVAYQQPLFVYIPPFAELRGGAWVVVDSTINADVMEFYAAEDARGGVLEAAGAASIKYRDRDVIATAHRVDDQLAAMDAQLKAVTLALNDATENRGNLEAEKIDLEKRIKQRERMLFGVFQQVAVHFADLHDTPGRMTAKGVIKKQVAWAQSRTFFYWRLRRRLFEFELAAELSRIKGSTSPAERRSLSESLRQFFLSHCPVSGSWDNDEQCLRWFESNPALLRQFKSNAQQSAVVTRLSAGLQEAVQVYRNSVLNRSGDDSDEDNAMPSANMREWLDNVVNQAMRQLD